MRYFTSIKSSVLIILLLLLTGFTSTHDQKLDNRYISPLGNFSVPIPKGVGQRVQDDNDKNGGMVSFHDDFGSLKSIFYLRLSPETQRIQDNPENQRANLKAFLNEYAMKWLIKPRSPDANILYQEHIKIGNTNAYFAIIAIPSGSTMFDAKANKRYDTKRGALIFVRGKFLYMLSSGENPSVFDLGNPPKPLDALVEREKKRLLSFKSETIFK